MRIPAFCLIRLDSRLGWMKSILTDPRLRGLPSGSPGGFAAQRATVLAKALVKSCYELWHRRLLDDADSVPGPYRKRAIMELGSGPGIIRRLSPNVITSEVVHGVADTVADGRRLPFHDASVRASLLTNVSHHMPDVHASLRESCRVLARGGVIWMIQVTRTPFVRFCLSKAHPEPFDDRSKTWDSLEGHSMPDSNQALSWVVLFRDRATFGNTFPALRLEEHSYLPWLGHLLSGGFNFRSFVPRRLAPAVTAMDRALKPPDEVFAIHWHIKLREVAEG